MPVSGGAPLPVYQSDFVAASIALDHGQMGARERLLGEARYRLMFDGALAITDNTLFCSPLLHNGFGGEELLLMRELETHDSASSTPLSVLLRSHNMAESIMRFVYDERGMRLTTPVLQVGPVAGESPKDAEERNWQIWSKLKEYNGESTSDTVGQVAPARKPDPRLKGWITSAREAIDRSASGSNLVDALLAPYLTAAAECGHHTFSRRLHIGFGDLLSVPTSVDGRSTQITPVRDVVAASEDTGWKHQLARSRSKLDQLKRINELEYDLYAPLDQALSSLERCDGLLRHSTVQATLRSAISDSLGEDALVTERDAYVTCRQVSEIDRCRDARSQFPAYWDFIVDLHRQGEAIKATAYSSGYGSQIASTGHTSWASFDDRSHSFSETDRPEVFELLGSLDRSDFRAVYRGWPSERAGIQAEHAGRESVEVAIALDAAIREQIRPYVTPVESLRQRVTRELPQTAAETGVALAIDVPISEIWGSRPQTYYVSFATAVVNGVRHLVPVVLSYRQDRRKQREAFGT